MLRFAPSPTGDMHIGNLRTALLNFIVSQQKKENFVIRIEDSDTKRNIEGKDSEIMQILEKFALTHHSVFHQSEHLHMHQTLAIKLLEQNRAFVCTCTPKEEEKNPYRYSGKCASKTAHDYKELKANKTPFVVRIKKPLEEIVYNDVIQGTIKTAPNEVDNFIILNQNGLPTYNFACACDDMLSGISMIIREEEHLSNTPRQKHIKAQLGYEEETLYAHIPTILHDDTSSLKWLFQEGFLPDAIINYLLLLGNSKAPCEIFTLPDAIAWFELESISKSPAKFDITKLRFINRQHLKRMDDKELSKLFGFADESIGKLAKLYLEEASTTKELQAKIEGIFLPKQHKGEWGEQVEQLKDVIQNAPMIGDFKTFQTYLTNKTNLKDEKLFKPLRLLLTNANNGPELSDLYPLIKSYLLEIAS